MVKSFRKSWIFTLFCGVKLVVGLEFITRGILEDFCQELLCNYKIRVEVCY